MIDSEKLPDQDDDGSESEINFLDILIWVAQYKRLIFGLPFIVAVLSAGYSLTMPNIFTASTTILPPIQGQSGAAAMLAQLGGLASGLIGGAGGGKSPNELYAGMLRSRTVADNLIQKFELAKNSEAGNLSQVREQLAGATRVSIGKDGIITVEVDDKDPKRAADMANSYVDELLKLTNVLAVTEAAQRRLFFERQLALAKDNLIKAESATREALESGGIVQVEGQGRSMLDAIARIRGQITVKEVQIGSMRNFAGDRYPELLLAQGELDALKRELARAEGTGGASKSGNVRPEAQGATAGTFGLLRNVKYFETVYELLAKQYEVAKIDEAKDSAVVQVMDPAIPPDRKSKPKRAVFVILSTTVALLIAVLIAYLHFSLMRARQNPDQLRRIEVLRGNLSLK